MSATSSPRMSRKLLFVMFAVLVIAGNWLAIATFERWQVGLIPEWPLAVDLLLLLPCAYLWVNRGRGRQALVGAAAIFGMGILVGGLMLPEPSKQLWSVLEQLRYVVLVVIVAVQAVLIGLIVREVRRARHERNLELAIEDAVARRFGRDGVARLLHLEARMWLYALCRRPIRQPFPGTVHFYGHANQGNASNQLGFLMLVGVEIPLVHLLLYLFNPLAAAVVTALSVYGFVFLLAEYRATLYRPISLGDGTLRIRYGLTGDVELPLTAIATVERFKGTVSRSAGRLRFVGMGEANVRLGLNPDTKLDALLGRRVIAEIFLGLDQPAAFMAALERELPAVG